MPGIYGFAKSKVLEHASIQAIASQMNLYSHFEQDNIFEDESIAASRVHLGKIGEGSSPTQIRGLCLWVEGEAYNHQQVATELGLGEQGLANLLLEAYQLNQFSLFLNRLDGYFCAVLYDAKQKQIKLISDRYGMRMLYWYKKNGAFVWASEVKGILACAGVDKTIDPTSFECFMDLGYLLGEHTWFQHIHLINPATILTINIQTQIIEQEYYWKWSEIESENLTFEQAVDELGVRFIEAVNRRFDPNEKNGIALSGGLDSRAIFAAVNHLYPELIGYAYTFGMPRCDDITIADQVITQSNWCHQKFYFCSDNWFFPRIEKIWNTDGMLDMMHMHGGEFVEDIAKQINVNLNGYCGDVIFGGGFLNKVPLNKRISADGSKFFYHDYARLANIDEALYDINKTEPNLYMNRIRRFTAMGTVNILIATEQRKPFFDNACVELVFSIPDEYRLNNRLYSAMLQKFFPKYFKNIPWQKTGKPADVINATLPQRAFNKGIRVLKSILNIKSTKDFTNYGSWIRSTEIANYLVKLLEFKTSSYKDLTNIDYQACYLFPHLNSERVNNSNQILRSATVEIYLRKVQGREV